MLSYGMLVLMTAVLVGIQTCQGTEGGHCPRNDCSLPATANRSRIDCWIKEGFCDAGQIHPNFPLKPENLKVNVYRTANNLFEFNITWQPGSNEKIDNLRGYLITIEEKLQSNSKVCFEMKFNNTLQKLDPLTDGQLMLHSDCASGFTEGIRKGHEYMVSVQSLPLPNRNGILTYISDESIFIGFCDSFSVTNGDVVPQVEGVYVNNEVVKVKCKPKHKLIGASALECLSPAGKGNWNYSIPECIEYQVDVEVFPNRSVLVNFEFLPNCPNGHFVRLRDLTHDEQPADKTKFVETGYTFMYENLTIGSWQACVSSYFCGSEVDYCHYFNITGPTTLAGPTTPTAPSTLVNTPKTLTSTKAKNPLKNTKTYVYSGVGCIGGLLLVVLVFRLRSSYKRDTSHTNLDESTITGSDRSLIVDNNNMMCVTPDLPLSHSLPDAITICSQSPTSVDIGIPPSGSV